MTVHPGFGGQAFMDDVMPKIEQLANHKEKEGLPYELVVDSGVKKENAERIRNAGATKLVAGNAVFKSDDYTRAIKELTGEE